MADQPQAKKQKKPQAKKQPATPAPEKPKAKEVFYFKNTQASGLKILIRGGTDELGQEGVEATERFTPYYDTWKGDPIKVGYLSTTNKKVADRCREDNSCEEISQKEYKEATEGVVDEAKTKDADNPVYKVKPLRKAPSYQA